MRPRRRPSIAQLLLVLLTATLALHVGLFVLTQQQLATAEDRDAVERDRLTATQTAERVRQGTDDLTMLVRLSVTTGERRYRDYYDELLAIRAGRVALPVGYTPGYWTEVIARGRPDPVPRSAPLRTGARLDPARFSRDELQLLESALATSGALARTERAAMRRAAAVRAELGTGRGYLAAVGPIYRRLTDQRYLGTKAAIVRLIRLFRERVDAGRTARVGDLDDRARRLLHVQTGLLVAVVPFDLAMLALAIVWIGRPLRRLIRSTRRIAEGAYDERAPESGPREVTILGGEFNRMASAVEQDVASRRRAERAADDARVAAQDADQAKSVFLARMSHELRTPLVGVSGTLDVLARSDLDAQQRELVRVADRSAQSLLDVIGDVLDFAKIEAGRLELHPEPASLTALVADVATQYENAASAKGLTISTVTEGTFADTYVLDPVRVRQIVANLVSNAVKFTDDGSVTVRTSLRAMHDDGHRVAIQVLDTGIGLGDDDRDGLLRPFAQANVSATRNAQGTGLGLAISHEIATMMGGDLRLRGLPQGGTEVTVEVVLPVAEGPVHQKEETLSRGRRPLPVDREAAEAEGSLLLLVEDHEVNRTVLVGQLETVGFRVDAVPGGRDALERLDHGRYGAVLSDVHMPGMDGYGLARAIRAREAASGDGTRVPIIALTASAVVEERDRCLAAGMDDLVTKPARLGTIADTLARWLPHVAWPHAGGDLIDRTVLELLSGGDAELARDVLADYVATTTDDVAALRRQLDAGDRTKLHRQAHRLKGASLLVGAAGVGERAKALEDAADTAPADELRVLLERIADAVDALVATIV